MTNGPSIVRFVATAAKHRVYIYQNACGTALVATPVVTYTCLSNPVPAPANDDPCGAFNLPISGTSCVSSVNGTTVGASATTVNSLGAGALSPTTGCPTPPVGFGTGQDVWFSVTVPPSGMIGISTTEATICAGAIGLYTIPTASTCAVGPYTWAAGTGLCSIDGLTAASSPTGITFNAFANGLVAGQTVYVRYWERNQNENGGFTICAFDAQRPVNDDVCGAIALPALPTCVPGTYSTENAQPSPPPGYTLAAPSCGNPVFPSVVAPGPTRDVWFQVTVPPTNAMTVTMSNGTLTDMAMAWYRPSVGAVLCNPPGPLSGTLTQIGCADNQSATNFMPRINSSTAGIALTGGETIYIRVWNRPAGQYQYSGTFQICVTANDPPPNDNPCGAILLDVNDVCVLAPFTNENATQTVEPFAPGSSTVEAPTCGVAPYSSDVWFVVDVPSDMVNTNQLIIDTDDLGLVAPAALDLAIAIYRDVSPSGCAVQMDLNLIPGACQLGGSVNGNASMPAITLTVGVAANQITPGERLYVRVWNQTPPEQDVFSICVRRTPPPPCQGTIFDTGGPAGDYNNGANIVTTYTPAKVGDIVILTFTQFVLEGGFDFIRIFDGPTIASPLIGVWTGGNSPGTVYATLHAGNALGQLTVQFTSDGSIVRPGYAFKITCSPPLPPPPAPVGDCGLQVTDPGGTGSMADRVGVNTISAPFQVTYCSDPGNPTDVVTLTFSSFDLEDVFDALYIFNDDVVNYAAQINSGNGAQNPNNLFGGGPPFAPAPPANGGFWGGSVIGPISATVTAGNPNGCLTLLAYTDFSVPSPGWSATVSCGPPPPPPVIGAGPMVNTACGSYYVDDGNFGDYTDSQLSSVRTICPAIGGQTVTLTFESFDVEDGFNPNSCFDMLYIYNGSTTGAPLFNSGLAAEIWAPFPNPHGPGGFCGTTLPGPFTSTDISGCLTLRFFADDLVEESGWRARITCSPKPPNDNPCDAGIVDLGIPTPVCTPVTGSNVASSNTPSIANPSCGNYQGRDVWYKFTAPASGRVYIDSRAGTLTDGGMALYSAAACVGPFTLENCDDDAGEGLMPAIDRTCNSLTPGNTYWIRFWGVGGATGTFELCLTALGGTTTLQSDCDGSFSLCNGGSFTASSFGNGCGNDLGTTNWGCLTGGEHQGSWYAFQVQNSGSLGMTITPSVPQDVDWGIWQALAAPVPNAVSANCVPGAAPVRCSYASQNNTLNSGGASANPAIATGMGRNAFTPATAAYAAPTPATNDALDGWVPGINVTAGQVYLLYVDDYHLNGASYNVTWTETPAVVGQPVMGCALLPVDDLALEAKPQATSVDLVWTTLNETNSSHFIVERSADGTVYEPIGTVDAAGWTNSTTEYHFVDLAPLKGLSYYRLQQMDHGGARTESNVVSVLFERESVGVLIVPNPARDRAELLLSRASEVALNALILDGSGRIVASFKVPMGTSRVEMPMAKLEAGSYTVQLYGERDVPYARSRFVKQ